MVLPDGQTVNGFKGVRYYDKRIHFTLLNCRCPGLDRIRLENLRSLLTAIGIMEVSIEVEGEGVFDGQHEVSGTEKEGEVWEGGDTCLEEELVESREGRRKRGGCHFISFY